MALAGVYGGRRAYFRIFCEGGVMKFYMKSFDFSGSLSSFFAVQLCRQQRAGKFFGYFQSFSRRERWTTFDPVHYTCALTASVASGLQEHSNFFCRSGSKHVDIFEKIQRVKSSRILLSATRSVAAVTAADNSEGCKSGIRGMFQNREV